MRVLLISDFFPPVAGGLEFHVDSLASALAERGHQVAVATTTADPVPTSSAVTPYAIRPATSRLIKPVEAHRPFPIPLPDPAARRQLSRVIAEFRPDVVHAHGWLAASLPRRHPPLVWTAHDYGLVCSRRTLLDQHDQICRGPAPGKCTRCARYRYGTLRAALLGAGTVVGRTIVRPDRVLAVSPAVAEALRLRIDAPIAVVENFVADSPAPTPLPPWFPDGPVVLFAGDPSRHKGIDVLLACWRDDPPPATLVIAATRPVEATLPPRVVTGSLTQGEMVTAWERATVAVIPSLWADPCPTVALEALRAGVPTVASKVGGLPHLIRDGIDGILVRPGDRIALRTAINDLLSSVPRRESLGNNARERARDFTVTSIVPRIESTYDVAMADRRTT
jgi:glycosyltransferase involved in cell wall biosynthesis